MKLSILFAVCLCLSLVAKDQSFAQDETDKYAIPLDSIKPVYPIKALVNRISATVYLKVKISPEGKPEQTQLDYCSRTWEGFEKAAKDAVMQVRFQPPPNTGRRKVSKWRTVVVKFNPYSDPYLGDTLPDPNMTVEFDMPAAPTKPIRIGLLNDGTTGVPVDTGSIKVLVDRNGFPRKTMIVRSGMTPHIDSLAVFLAKTQQFTPATYHATPLATWIEVPFTYIRPEYYPAKPSLSVIALPRPDILMPLLFPPNIDIELGYADDSELVPLRPFQQNLTARQFEIVKSALSRMRFQTPPGVPANDTTPLIHQSLLMQTQLTEIDWSAFPKYTDEESNAGSTSVTPPVLTYSGPASYSEFARFFGISTTLEIAVLVDADGCVRLATLTKESSTALFNRSILEAVILNRYTPAKRDGTPVPVWFTYTLDLGEL